jgi:hypothetical protein
VAPKQNLDFCPAVKKVGEVATVTLTSAKTVAEKIARMVADFDPLNAEIDAIRAQMREASRTRNDAKAALDSAEARKQEMITAVTTAKSDLDLCKVLNPDCSAEQGAYDAAVAELRSFVEQTYIPAQRAYATAKVDYDSLFEEYSFRTTLYADALTPLFDLQARLFELNTQVNDIYNKYVRLSGFTSTLTYSTNWAAAVQSFAAVNPGKSVSRMPLKATQLSASAVGVESFDTDTPSIISFAIPGVVSGRSVDLMAMPTGSEPFPSLGSPMSSDTRYEDVFGDSIGAQINVSLMGACPFYPNGIAGGIVGDISDLTAEIAMNAHYTFELQVRRGYTARYNMFNWASRVERVTKKGGFFSSKTLREVVESSSSSDWFDITFNASSGAFNYSPEEQERITKEVKGQLQERGLLLIARQMSILPGSAATPPSLQPTGAGAAAAYLMHGCGFWSWCRVGSFVLGTLNSIFGSSTAVADFKKSNNVWVTESVNGVSFLEQGGALTFQKQ